VFLVLSPGKAVVFLLVHQGLWGVYMGLAFAPNHKGMPTTTGEHSWDFLRKQVLTSRNVRGGRWVDTALGGLNYQIEHHLFPSMPRPSLRRAQPWWSGSAPSAGSPTTSAGCCAPTATSCATCTPSARRCARGRSPRRPRADPTTHPAGPPAPPP
jgi:fatty acid desaturase